MARYTYWVQDVVADGVCTCDFLRYEGTGDDLLDGQVILFDGEPILNGDCQHCKMQEVLDEPEPVTINEAKQLLKTKGGFAYTLHVERDGTVIERTPVTLSNKNARDKRMRMSQRL